MQFKFLLQNYVPTPPHTPTRNFKFLTPLFLPSWRGGSMPWLFSENHNYKQVDWDDMARNRCQHNISQIFEENCYIFIFYLPINFNFLQDAISGIYFTFIPVNLDYFCSNFAISGFKVSVTNDLL